jgi:hypothetical protein
VLLVALSSGGQAVAVTPVVGMIAFTPRTSLTNTDRVLFDTARRSVLRPGEIALGDVHAGVRTLVVLHLGDRHVGISLRYYSDPVASRTFTRLIDVAARPVGAGRMHLAAQMTTSRGPRTIADRTVTLAPAALRTDCFSCAAGVIVSGPVTQQCGDLAVPQLAAACYGIAGLFIFFLTTHVCPNCANDPNPSGDIVFVTDFYCGSSCRYEGFYVFPDRPALTPRQASSSSEFCRVSYIPQIVTVFGFYFNPPKSYFTQVQTDAGFCAGEPSTIPTTSGVAQYGDFYSEDTYPPDCGLGIEGWAAVYAPNGGGYEQWGGPLGAFVSGIQTIDDARRCEDI